MFGIILSINLPIERMPAPCISRLFSGGFPHATGKTFFTAVQYVVSTWNMPSKSVSLVVTFRNGYKQPFGELMLSSIAFMSEESAIGAFDASSGFIEERRMSL